MLQYLPYLLAALMLLTNIVLSFFIWLSSREITADPEPPKERADIRHIRGDRIKPKSRSDEDLWRQEQKEQKLHKL